MTDTAVQDISDDESSLDSRQDPLVHDAERSAAREAASVYAHFEGMDGPANARDEMQANVAAANAMRYAQVLAKLRLRRITIRMDELHQEVQDDEDMSLARQTEIINEMHALRNEANEAMAAM